MREFVFWMSVVGIISFVRFVDFLEARLEKSSCLFGCAKNCLQPRHSGFLNLRLLGKL
jgi:hypothetical protein